MSEVRLLALSICCITLRLTAQAWPESTAVDVRPANLFELVTSHDTKECHAILKSLNEKYVFPIVPNEPDTDRGSGKYLLTTDMQVHWHQVVGENGEYMDFADVDFQNEGKIQRIYRYPVGLSGEVPDSVGTSTYDPGDLEGSSLTRKQLSEKIEHVKQAPGSLSSAGNSVTPQWKSKKDAPANVAASLYVFTDVLSGAVGTYMLTTSIREAQEFYEDYVVLKHRRRLPRSNLYLLKYVNDGDVPMVCHFRTRK